MVRCLAGQYIYIYVNRLIHVPDMSNASESSVSVYQRFNVQRSGIAVKFPFLLLRGLEPTWRWQSNPLIHGNVVCCKCHVSITQFPFAPPMFSVMIIRWTPRMGTHLINAYATVATKESFAIGSPSPTVRWTMQDQDPRSQPASRLVVSDCDMQYLDWLTSSLPNYAL